MYTVIAALLKILFKQSYHHQTFGLENLPAGCAILAPNHSSYLDPPLICVSCPDEIYYVARSSLFRNPFFGWLIKHLNALPVSQDRQDSKMLKQVLDLLDQGKKIVLFPEGQRSFNGEIGPLERGVALIALRSQCPIVPTYISGAHTAWPRKNKFPKMTGCTACFFGTPILPEKYSHLDKKKAIEALTQDLSKSLRKLSIIAA